LKLYIRTRLVSAAGSPEEALRPIRCKGQSVCSPGSASTSEGPFLCPWSIQPGPMIWSIECSLQTEVHGMNDCVNNRREYNTTRPTIRQTGSKHSVSGEGSEPITERHQKLSVFPALSCRVEKGFPACSPICNIDIHCITDHPSKTDTVNFAVDCNLKIGRLELQRRLPITGSYRCTTGNHELYSTTELPVRLVVLCEEIGVVSIVGSSRIPRL